MRSRTGLISLLTIALLVLTQLAVVAYACVKPAQMAQMSAMSMPAISVMAAMPDCEQSMDQQQPLLCKAHCQKDEQSADSRVPSLPLPFLMLAYVFAPVLAEPLLAPLAYGTQMAALDHYSPPLRIQYQVFRN